MRDTLINIRLCTEAYEQGAPTFPEVLPTHLGMDDASHSDDGACILSTISWHSQRKRKELIQ